MYLYVYIYVYMCMYRISFQHKTTDVRRTLPTSPIDASHQVLLFTVRQTSVQTGHHDVEIAKEQGPTFKRGKNKNKWAISNAQGFTNNLYSRQPTTNNHTSNQAAFFGLQGLVWAGGTLRVAHLTFRIWPN